MNLVSPTISSEDAESPDTEPLNVWSIITSLASGGAESLIVSLNACFADEGVKHTVVALCDAETVGNSPATEQRLAKQIRDEGGEFVSLGLGRLRDPLSGGRALNLLLGRDEPELIHAHTARAIPMVAWSRFGGRVILTHHNSRLTFPRLFFRYIDTVVDGYVAISPETEAIYSEQCRKPAKRISNGVSSDFLATESRQAAKTPCGILSVGAISDQKNYSLLIDTAREVQSRQAGAPIAVFLIAGAGEGLADLRRQVEDEGLQDIVHFLGERSDVAQLLGDADLFLNTSHYEGQSVAILEAMAMALPVVATDVPGNHDLVAHEQTGILAGRDDPVKLADAILRLTEDRTLYASLSRGARRTGAQFSAAKTAASHLELYSSLASKG